MQNTLTGKVALVTGASRGIGRAIALKLAAEGAAVVINYHGSMEKAKEVKAEIESDGGIAEIMQCNVADYQATEAMIRKVTDDFGRLDILVNNAGITRDGLLMKMSEEDYDTVLDTNLKGTFHCIRFAARQTKRRKNYQSVISFRNPWECRTGKLLGIQSRRDRTDQKCCKRTCIQRNYCQCSRSGIY